MLDESRGPDGRPIDYYETLAASPKTDETVFFNDVDPTMTRGPYTTVLASTLSRWEPFPSYKPIAIMNAANRFIPEMLNLWV